MLLHVGQNALPELVRVLRPGGHLILNVTNQYAYIGWLDGPYRLLKKSKIGWATLDWLKRALARKGPLSILPDRRTHSPHLFDRELGRAGLRKVSHNYFHFSPLPMPLDSVFPGVSRPIGRMMEGLTRNPIAVLLGGGYLVMARKT